MQLFCKNKMARKGSSVAAINARGRLNDLPLLPCYLASSSLLSRIFSRIFYFFYLAFSISHLQFFFFHPGLSRMSPTGFRIIPISSAQCERGFSAQRRIKSDVRSRLHVSTTEDLIRISMEGPELEAFDPTPAVVKWFSSGQRSRHPNFAYRRWPDELISVADSWDSLGFRMIALMLY